MCRSVKPPKMVRKAQADDDRLDQTDEIPDPMTEAGGRSEAFAESGSAWVWFPGVVNRGWPKYLFYQSGWGWPCRRVVRSRTPWRSFVGFLCMCEAAPRHVSD